MSGRFIVLEGGDGVGKTTQVGLLSRWLDAIGARHVVVREPGGTSVGEAIRTVVLDRTDLDVPPEAELMLLLAARAALVGQVVRPALDRGETVVADRYALSTLAYQVFGRGLDQRRVRQAIEAATGGLSPDLYLVLDLSVEESLERHQRGGAEADRIEQEGQAFRRAVRDAYLALAESEPGVEVLSAQGTPDDVHERIRALLESRFPRTFAGQPADVKG